jgi:hypothetical protein
MLGGCGEQLDLWDEGELGINHHQLSPPVDATEAVHA